MHGVAEPHPSVEELHERVAAAAAAAAAGQPHPEDGEGAARHRVHVDDAARGVNVRQPAWPRKRVGMRFTPLYSKRTASSCLQTLLNRTA